MQITVDEWIAHFISDPQKRKDALKFLEKLLQKSDKLVTLRGGPLNRKIFRMAEESATWDSAGRDFVKWFMGEFLNSENFLMLYESNLQPLSKELEQETPSDDLYLVKTAINTADRFIVTTDNRLKEKLSHRQELTIRLVDEFLQQYDC